MKKFLVKIAAASALLGAAGVASAGVSVTIGVPPIVIGGPVPFPVYMPPPPPRVVIQPAPVYYPAPVYRHRDPCYDHYHHRGYHHRHHGHHGHHRHHGGYDRPHHGYGYGYGHRY